MKQTMRHLTVLVACAVLALPCLATAQTAYAIPPVITTPDKVDSRIGQLEAVGLITSRTATTFRFATLDLFGVTEEGRVVSRGSYVVNGTFGGPQSFSVRLTPTGKEARYQLQVGNYSLGRDL